MGLFTAEQIEEGIVKNFWELNKTLITGSFKLSFDSDKSKNKKDSSKLMWCIVLICDDNSKYYKLPTIGEDNKLVIIFEEFYSDKDYYYNNVDKCNELINYYEKLSSTTASRLLKSIEKLMDERAMFLNGIGYLGCTIDNALELDKLLISTDKITSSYELALSRLVKETNTKSKGNLIKSLSDKGEI